MNQELLDKLALRTGGSLFPEVFQYYQKQYVMQLLSEMHQILQEIPFDAYAIDFWDDVIRHFQLDNNEIEKLLKNNKESA